MEEDRLTIQEKMFNHGKEGMSDKPGKDNDRKLYGPVARYGKRRPCSLTPWVLMVGAGAGEGCCTWQAIRYQTHYTPPTSGQMVQFSSRFHSLLPKSNVTPQSKLNAFSIRVIRKIRISWGNPQSLLPHAVVIDMQAHMHTLHLLTCS